SGVLAGIHEGIAQRLGFGETSGIGIWDVRLVGVPRGRPESCPEECSSSGSKSRGYAGGRRLFCHSGSVSRCVVGSGSVTLGRSSTVRVWCFTWNLRGFVPRGTWELSLGKSHSNREPEGRRW